VVVLVRMFVLFSFSLRGISPFFIFEDARVRPDESALGSPEALGHEEDPLVLAGVLIREVGFFMQLGGVTGVRFPAFPQSPRTSGIKALSPSLTAVTLNPVSYLPPRLSEPKVRFPAGRTGVRSLPHSALLSWGVSYRGVSYGVLSPSARYPSVTLPPPPPSLIPSANHFSI